MKLTKHLSALLLCTVLLFCLVGCHTSPASIQTTASAAPTGAELYSQAVTELQNKTYTELKASITRTTTIGADVYTKTIEQTLTWKNWNTDSMQAKIKETAVIGEQTTQSSAVYRDGTAYTVIDGNTFVSEITADAFCAMWLSVVPLSESLYGTVTAQSDANGITLLFEDASAPESWAAPEYAQLSSASGTATLDANGSFTGFTYTAAFNQGGAGIDLTAEITVYSPTILDFTLDIPDTDDRYVPVDTPEILYLIADSCGYLAQSCSATSTVSQTISSEALGTTASFTTELAASTLKNDFAANITQSANFEFYQNGTLHDTYSYKFNEHFVDGVYSSFYDDETPQNDAAVTQEVMSDYCVNTLTANYPYLPEVTGASITDFGEICLLELDCSTALAQSYSRFICEYLTDDASILDTLATVYKTTAMDYYVAINRATGLPTACGINFSGIHTIDDIPYNLSYQTAQTFYISDPDAYETVTGEAPPEQEPAQRPTPLFYHVTGSNGEEMWLLGTIHLGDARTAYFPQEIYDALDASNALAVEFDDENFEQLLESDPQLLSRLISSYYYLDGTTALDHLDPQIYTAGMSLLKAIGISQSQAAVMKPYAWSQLIENFYIDQNYGLNHSKGVDTRLMEYARTHDISILNVESGIEQVEMLSSFSDAVQEMLLGSSLSCTPSAYYQDVQELYEMWCAGDEAVLTQYLSDDTSQMSKQELALYKEYNKAMMTDRNASMLEAAKGYLSNGDVVFYAVGLAHLLAEDGLVNTLRQAGYTVEPVTYGE